MGHCRARLLGALTAAALAVPPVASADGGFTNASFSFGTTNKPGDTVIVTFTVSGQPMYGAAIGLNGPFAGMVTSVSDPANACGPNYFQNNSEWPTYQNIWGAQCTWSGANAPQPGQTYVIKLVTSDTYGGSTILLNNVIVNGGGPVSAPPPPPPPPKDKQKELEKLLAKLDMINALNDAQAPCAQSTLGAAAGVWGATVPGAGAIATVPAVVLGATAGTRCTQLINRAYQDALIVNDPPAGAFLRLAYPRPIARASALPSCSRFSGRARTFCTKLRPLAREYLAAVKEVAAIDAALVQTVDMQSAAANAGNATALAQQDAQGQQLETQLSAAIATEHKLGKKIAKVVKAYHVSGNLSKHQDAHGIAYIKKSLEQKGLSATSIETLAGSALKPHAIKILAVMR
jgi:hypothetical protein